MNLRAPRNIADPPRAGCSSVLGLPLSIAKGVSGRGRMTKFQTIQLTNFLTEQNFAKGCSSIQEYERAKKLLFPFCRPDPIPELNYTEMIFFIVDWLKV